MSERSESKRPKLLSSHTPRRAIRINDPELLGHALGEWTDDTSMAVPILQALTDGTPLEDAAERILAGWQSWRPGARDVGNQISAVLGSLSATPTEAEVLAASQRLHDQQGRSGGNGCLLRTGPVALGYLDRDPAELAEAAARIARLTRWEHDATDACVLWSLAIRHAILTGELDILSQVAHLPAERRQRWLDLIDAVAGKHPRDFAAQNGWVVAALQGALAAIEGATSLQDALERAVRSGHDTDTVAAIAGSLVGALWGASALPAAWLEPLHGWPGLRADDLVVLATRAVS